jgi:hypothetical protein
MESVTVKTVDQRLRDAAELFSTRDAAYGTNYLNMGPALMAMFGGPLTVETADEWQRVFTVIMQMTKLSRYAQNVKKGGHEDSADDGSVYWQMAAYTDALARAATQKTGVIVTDRIDGDSDKSDFMWKMPQQLRAGNIIRVDNWGDLTIVRIDPVANSNNYRIETVNGIPFFWSGRAPVRVVLSANPA